MQLVEPEVHPANEKAAAKHCAVGALNKAYGPHYECKKEAGQRDVAVGDLAHGRSVYDMIWHRLFDSH